jgi:hypothetical protein
VRVRSGIRHLGLHTLLIGVVLATASACASSTAQSAGGRADVSMPSNAAVAYVTALFSGDVDRAAEFILPGDQNLFRYIADGVTSNSTRSENIKAAAVTVVGEKATVILTGTLCTTPSLSPTPMPSNSPSTQSPTISSDNAQCVSNTDPHTTNPIFQVMLKSGDAGHWYVDYGSSGGSTIPTSAPSSDSGMVLPTSK